MSLDYTIRLYELLPDGDLEALSGGPVEQYGNSCPNVGDTIARYDVLAERFKFYNVQRRIFIDSSDLNEGWAILIRAVDASPLMIKVADEWLDETKFWGEVDEKEDWQYQYAERKKHHPHHRLDARLEGVLRYMIEHPDSKTVDLIPQAGDKTMEALLKVGVVRTDGKDAQGARQWVVTDEGRTEVERIETYRNWKFS